MNARLLYLTLVSEMSIRPNGLPAKLTHALPLSALPAFFMAQTGSLCRTLCFPRPFLTVLSPARSPAKYFHTEGGEQEQTCVHS